jgi:hypothetical protein
VRNECYNLRVKTLKRQWHMPRIRSHAVHAARLPRTNKCQTNR